MDSCFIEFIYFVLFYNGNYLMLKINEIYYCSNAVFTYK